MREFSKRPSPFEMIDRFFDPTQRPLLTLDDWLETFDIYQESNEWENVAFACLLYIHYFSLQDIQTEDKRPVVDKILSKIESFLQHPEPRVRTTATRIVTVLTTTFGFDVYSTLVSIIHTCVQHDQEREVLTRPVVLGNETELALDEVTGWRALESSYAAFNELISGMQQHVRNCGTVEDADVGRSGDMSETSSVSPNESLRQWKCTFCIAPLSRRDCEVFLTGAALHVNRYVRQAACVLVQTMCSTHRFPPTPTIGVTPLHKPRPGSHEKPAVELVQAVCRLLAVGLQDSWCQVRLAATQATKAFLLSLHTAQHLYEDLEEHAIWPLLLPRLCMNRHYPTDSVRSAAHSAWACGVGEGGKVLLARYVGSTVQYYVCMSRHKNHMVCEAACGAMAELGGWDDVVWRGGGGIDYRTC